ncbi:5-formyltetrahydrofolate cyclo-ligase [Peptoniphilus sp. ING2-D1G]|nr:5-formyltetrahydrofolate cyclo-ligase [Peptoniphilus sp. ING2-D1G]
MDKKEFRALALKKREQLDKDYTEKSNAKIFEVFIQSELYKRSEDIFIFVSYKNEVDTHRIIVRALADGKRIYVPVVNKETKTMEASRLKSFDILTENYMGILEPPRDKYDIVDKNLPDLIVTPGLAFDKKGYRIGYGGGFYDKFFSNLTSTPAKMGIGYYKQFVEDVIHDERDIALDYFLSENGLVKLGGN